MAAITAAEVLSLFFVFVVCFVKIGELKKVDLRSMTSEDEFIAYSSENSVTIEHSLEEHSGAQIKYTNRGTLNFRSLKPGPGTFTQTSALTAGEKRKLKELTKVDGLYKIRVAAKFGIQPESEEVKYVSTYTKACPLVTSRLSDHVTIHADQSGSILGVSIVPSKGSCDQVEMESSALNYFNTTVTLDMTVPAPIPDTQAYVQKIEEEKIQKAKGTSADNRSFFAKYWMYIVPVVIFVMMSSGQGGGGGS